MISLDTISRELPVLIAGPTASGKSALALEIAAAQGGVIVNADALQVYEGWRILTARPSPGDEATAPHHLYGHVPFEAEYSVGDWLRALRPLLSGDARPIIVGGTGLYFRALTEGLAEVPAVPPEVRAEADAMPAAALLDALDRA
ncbi:tRNA (adenosine(37)-N6)-dimethylallyltransferase MiaA, partial [Rhodobacterales bacterium HKCCSP123]|nr:tRNA (adenosine(37)-N6)-dimethylallyltransferase MiaA [Rhodobacterales bacterium HKCCSP123]